MPPRFSVILPTHDRLELLREAIASVVAQSCADWELLVVDDASSRPLTHEELLALAGPNARLIALAESHGGAAAKSAGAREARGQVLAFLDDDDLWRGDYLEKANAALLASPEVRVLFMGVRWFGERGEAGQQAQDRGMDIIRRQAGADPDSAGLARFQDGLFEALLDRVPMPFQRPVVRREDYLAIGDYRPECLLWDCDWALRAALHGECALLDEGLYLQRAAGQGYSSQGHRALEHTRSNLEIKESLLRHPAAVEPGRQRALLRALHRGWLDYCWQLRQRGEWREAEDALRKSARYGLSGSFLKMLAAAVLRRLGIGKRPASA
jgi:glycosyltransferase involved in cell wall biosynthesis